MLFTLMCRVHITFVCNDSFRLVRKLKVHQCVHSGEHRYHSDVCNNSSMVVEHLKVHQCVHSVEHSYGFNVHNKTFSDTSNLNEALL
jgi:hypothetical protein